MGVEGRYTENIPGLKIVVGQIRSGLGVRSLYDESTPTHFDSRSERVIGDWEVVFEDAAEGYELPAMQIEDIELRGVVDRTTQPPTVEFTVVQDGETHATIPLEPPLNVLYVDPYNPATAEQLDIYSGREIGFGFRMPVNKGSDYLESTPEERGFYFPHTLVTPAHDVWVGGMRSVGSSGSIYREPESRRSVYLAGSLRIAGQRVNFSREKRTSS